MAYARYANDTNEAQLHGISSQQERNEIAQIGADDYESLPDEETHAKTYENITADPTVNESGASSPQRTDVSRTDPTVNDSGASRPQRTDATRTGTAPSWVDLNPRKSIVLAVVALFLLSLLTSVATSVVVHKMIQTNIDASQASANQNKNHSDALGNLAMMNRRTDEKVHLLYEMQKNHSDAFGNLTDMTRRTDEIQKNHSDALGNLTEMNRRTDEIQKNHSDALGALTEMNRRTDEIQKNHSDALGNPAMMNRRTDEKVNLLYEMQKNHSDALGQLTELNLRLNETKDALQKLRSKLNSLDSDLTACTTCQTGWTLHGGSCYLTNLTNRRTFSDALTYCEGRGGYLVEIETAAENDFVKQYTGSRYSFWIGMTDAVQEGVWKWYHSGNKVQFTDWGTGEPSHNDSSGNVENCAEMHRTRTWNDIPCTVPIRPLCEKNNPYSRSSEDYAVFVCSINRGVQDRSDKVGGKQNWAYCDVNHPCDTT